MDNQRIRVLGKGSSWVRSLLAAGVTLFVLVGPPELAIVLMSYLRPQINTYHLYRFCQWGSTATLFLVAMCVFVTSVLALASKRSALFRSVSLAGFDRFKTWFYAGLVVLALLFLETIIPGFRHVHPVDSRWISTGHAGPWEVSEAAAKTYLWHDIRLQSLTILLFVFVLGIASMGCIRAMKSAQK